METRECNIPGWKPADIGCFYPDMPYAWGTAEVVDKEDKVYYRSVYAFTNRLRVAAQTEDPAKMSSNLTCFRGEAARWWNNEVDELVRGGLIHTRDIYNWCSVLEERFDDEQEFYGAQGYNPDDSHSDDLPDGDYPFEESYANYSDSPTNNNAVNETQVQLADDANDLSEAYTRIHGDNSSSNNKLHKHLRTGDTNSMDSNAYHATALVPKVMESSIYNNIEPSRSFPGIPLGIHAKPPHTTPCSIYDEQQVVIPPFTQAYEDVAEMARVDYVLRIGPAHGIGVANLHDTTAYVQRQSDNKLRELQEFVSG